MNYKPLDKQVPASDDARLTAPKQLLKGFARVLAGGKVVRPNNTQPLLQRMVTGEHVDQTFTDGENHAKAVLDSVASNLSAGIKIVDQQEIVLAKIGGRLSEIALCLNQAVLPESSHSIRKESQVKFEKSRDTIRDLSQTTFNNASLFSDGPSKPITIAVPNQGTWEGISIERADIGKPGLKSIDQGKVEHDATGYFLDHSTIRRAFDEWRFLCASNRMQWGLLVDRLHGVNRTLRKICEGQDWNVPVFPSKNLGPLRRPNRNN
jgi:hypothetical protein